MKRMIIQSGDSAVSRYLDLAEPFHRAYAEQCGADFWRFDGQWEKGVPPAWNRIPMMLRLFTEIDGDYDQVLWLDADTLVVQPEINVFERAPFDHLGSHRAHHGEESAAPWEHRPFVMRRTAGGFYWPMDGADQWEGWNDGVLLAGRAAAPALQWLWDHRQASPLPHHQPRLWELNWLLDHAKLHPEDVSEMDERFNWQPFNGASPEQYAVIKAWHGLPHTERWDQMQACAALLEEGQAAVIRTRDTTPALQGPG